MCGRYLRRSDKQRIAEAFRLLQDLTDIPLPPDFNVAPSTFQPVIRLNRDTHQRELVLMRWGLVPHFATSLAEYKSLFTINARSETVTTNRLWRRPFERHRCLVPADGFYEWQKTAALPPLEPAPPSAGATKARKPKAAPKQPWVFTVTPEASPRSSAPSPEPSPIPDLPFAFAGLWDAWRDPLTGDWLQTFAILTTDSNSTVTPIHNRMPVILEPRDYDRWLDRSPTHQPPIDLLRPLDPAHLERRPANPAVNNVRNNSPDLLAPPSGDQLADGSSPPAPPNSA